MWFKQIQLFQLSDKFDYSVENIETCLEKLLFKPCLPSMPSTLGWVTLLDEEDAPLVRSINQCVMFCLQVEEKILPAAVIRQALIDKIKQIEIAENRKVRSKEKFSLKDEIIMTLLPRAFSKLTRVYAYIDARYRYLVLGTANFAKTEQFLSAFKKTLGEKIQSFELKKLAPLMTHWLKEKSYPSSLAVEKTCVLQDSRQQNRMIRCQQQDLFASSIQAFIKDGCEVKQLAVTWQDQISFVIAEDFSLRNIQFQDEIREQIKEMEPETKQHQLDADFLIMSTTLSGLLNELLTLFIKSESLEKSQTDKDTIFA
jgi:recombination associated protein RdgC